MASSLVNSLLVQTISESLRKSFAKVIPNLKGTIIRIPSTICRCTNCFGVGTKYNFKHKKIIKCFKCKRTGKVPIPLSEIFGIESW